MVRKTIKEIGAYEITAERKSGTGFSRTEAYAVEGKYTDEFVAIDELSRGSANGPDPKDRAVLLARVMDSVKLDIEVPPPEAFEANKGSSVAWAVDANAIPARVSALGKAKQAAYLASVYGESPGMISNALDVGEQTVTQYLSDVRRGER